ncbi:hypothetical protein BOX15_Mlig004233g1 [Macrostomum lignano]|nr:hypothetical protein BOX15_Mlig004233g1 [Macrostomum lignano]
MDRDSEQRYFISGYSGFVPRLRQRLGGTYPVLTHDALEDFDRARRLHAAALAGLEASDAEAVGEEKAAGQAGRGRLRGRRGEGVIYRKCEGLLPNYYGHIPGHRRRFGQSFGRITVNARELA